MVCRSTALLYAESLCSGVAVGHPTKFSSIILFRGDGERTVGFWMSQRSTAQCDIVRGLGVRLPTEPAPDRLSVATLLACVRLAGISPRTSECTGAHKAIARVVTHVTSRNIRDEVINSQSRLLRLMKR